MADLKYFNALFDEHAAEPGRLFRPEQNEVSVIVRSFLDGDATVRRIIQAGDEGVDQQLLVSRDGLRALADSPQTLEGYLFADPHAEPVRTLRDPSWTPLYLGGWVIQVAGKWRFRWTRTHPMSSG